MSGGRNKLLAFFLQSSPLAQQRKLNYVLTLPQSRRYFPNHTPSDRTYTMFFLNSLEALGPSPAFVGGRTPPPSDQVLKSMSSFPRHARPHCLRHHKNTTEDQQFAENIQTCTKPAFPGSHLYGQLEHRLQVVPDQLVCKYSKKLRYLLKILINKREKIRDDLVELESNTQLATAVSNALSRVGRDLKTYPTKIVDPEATSEDKEREAPSEPLNHEVKLKLGHSHLRQGLKDDAIDYFSSIYLDSQAPLPTRLEAVQQVCRIHESTGVISPLHTLHQELKAIDAPQLERCVVLALERMLQATVKT